MSTVRRATSEDAPTLGRLLWDFNTEFETETDAADVLAERFARILELPEIVAVLAEDGGEAVGFALVSLRPAAGVGANSSTARASGSPSWAPRAASAPGKNSRSALRSALTCRCRAQMRL